MSDFISTNDSKVEPTPFSDDDIERPDVSEDDEAPGLSPVERATRKERRTLRIKSKLKEGETAKEELVRERAEKQALAERVARLEGVVSAQQAGTRPAAVDHYAERLASIRAKQAREYQSALAEQAANGGKLPDERARHYEQVAAEIEDEKMQVGVDRALAKQVPVIQQTAARDRWKEKYPEVYAKPEAYAFAEARRNVRMALGEKETVELVNEVMDEAMATFKLGPKRGATANERARMSGVSSSGGGGGDNRVSGGIQMTPELRRMALAAAAGDTDDKGRPLSDDAKIKKWVDGPGRELRKQKVL